MDIILLAMLAGYLVYKLYQALGQDEEDQINSRERQAPLHQQTIEHDSSEQTFDTNARPSAQNGFDVGTFLPGAKRAFEIILEAYAKGDTVTLQPLLSPELYKLYASSIERRNKKKETLENTVVRIKSTEVLHHEFKGAELTVKVKFVSEQIFVIKDKQGLIIEGNPDLVEEIVDIWSFSRDIDSSDPNWILVSSQSNE